MSLITIIGRGHSGTRAISHTLYGSGVFMGRTINASGDMVPPGDMYDACRVFAKQVRWLGDLNWDFSAAHEAEIDPEFTELIKRYLEPVLARDVKHKGWKIPETTLVYPWIIRMFPQIKYIFWIRNPRDCILSGHLTDDMSRFGIEYPPTEDERLRRAISWKYQYDLVKSTPKPAHWLEVRFEDFVLNQEETLERLEDFLEMKLARIIVRPDAVERYRQDDGVNYFDFFAPAMREYGYEIP
ncbi:MAG: sulfotransferase [Anaerolineales bacterium]|nr:sulfotransferase [Anaerolineales bacterium]MCB0005483.1 sulfotransferase [Anaerolineales bacterium]MCB8960256.1 sulfotransferase [Ardenticatenales bacterium]